MNNGILTTNTIIPSKAYTPTQTIETLQRGQSVVYIKDNACRILHLPPNSAPGDTIIVRTGGSYTAGYLHVLYKGAEVIYQQGTTPDVYVGLFISSGWVLMLGSNYRWQVGGLICAQENDAPFVPAPASFGVIDTAITVGSYDFWVSEPNSKGEVVATGYRTGADATGGLYTYILTPKLYNIDTTYGCVLVSSQPVVQSSFSGTCGQSIWVNDTTIVVVYKTHGASTLSICAGLWNGATVYSWGTPTVVSGSVNVNCRSTDINICKVEDNKFVVFYSTGSSAYAVVAQAVTVSGTTFTVGGATTISAGSSNGTSMLRVHRLGTGATCTVGFAWADSSTAYLLNVATIPTGSSTTLTVGSTQTVANLALTYLNILTDESSGLHAYLINSTNSYLSVRMFTVSGTTITFGTLSSDTGTVNTVTPSRVNPAYRLSPTTFVTACAAGSTNYGMVVVHNGTSVTSITGGSNVGPTSGTLNCGIIKTGNNFIGMNSTTEYQYQRIGSNRATATMVSTTYSGNMVWVPSCSTDEFLCMISMGGYIGGWYLKAL